MQVITDAKELEKHTYIKTRNPAVFPKKERLGLAQRMMNEASDLVADLMEANDLLLTDPEERELRYRAQRSALRNCRKLIHHIELAHEILSGFGDDAFAYWAKMAAGVKNQTAKWYKTDKERAAKLDARRDYSFGPYYPFKVYEPKERLVLAIDFEGKVVQHSLCDNVLEPAFSRRFIRDNYAGQIGKGTHDGLDRLAAAMRHYFFSRKAADEAARKAAGLPPRPMNEWYYADGWVLKGDFSKFFYTLLHSYCYETARRALKWLKDPELIDFAEWLLWLIIDSTPDPGIPIGNQSSQLLALLYLDAFDHWLRDDRGLVYGRYMDDFYIIHSDKLLLRQILKEIEAYIKPLGLRLNGKTQILPLKNGIDFLGFHTYLTQTGKVVRKVRAKSIDNMKRKIRKFRGLVDSGKMTLDSVVQSYASWTGHISHGNTYHLRQNMDAYFFSYFPELKPSPKGDTTHGPKTEQPRKQVEGQVRQPVRQPDHLDRGR